MTIIDGTTGIDKVVDGSIATVDLADGAVTEAKRANGVTDGSSAAAGVIGESISATGSGVSIAANNTYYDIASVTLTAGDWDVSYNSYAGAGTTTGAARYVTGIGTVAGNSGAGLTLSNSSDGPPPVNAYNVNQSVPSYRVSTSSSVTLYLKNFMTFSTGAGVGYGRISARRVR